MKGLILKDIRLCKIPFLFGIFFEVALLLSIMYLNYIKDFENIPSIFLGMVGIGFLFTTTCANSQVVSSIDRDDNMEILIRSLPITKEKIIISKAINPIIIYNIFICISFVPSLIILKFFGNPINLNYLILYYLIGFILSYVISILNLYVALIFPNGKILSYCRFLNIVIFICFGQIIKLINSIITKNISKTSLIAFLVCILVGIFTAFISKEILKRYKMIEV